MKKLIAASFVIIIMLTYIGCKCNSDILARYGDTTITRGQFKQWLEDKQFPVETILKNKKQQRDKLELMAIESIALKEMQKDNLQASEKLKFLEDMAFESVLLKTLYDKKIKKNTDFNEPAFHIKQIFLRVRDFKIVNNKRVNLTKSELEKAYGDVENKAREIIGRLKNGEKFEELAKQFSDDFSKKNGGDIGYIVKDMIQPSLYQTINEANIGLVETPIRTANGIYIIQIVEKQNVTKKNLNKIIKDEMQAKRLEQILLKKASNNYIDNLMSAQDVQFNEQKCKSKNPNDIIYKVGDTIFTVGDLGKRISYFKHDQPMIHQSAIEDTKKVEIAKNAFKVALLRRAAINENMHNGEELKKEVEKRKQMLFAKEYMDYIAGRDVTVTPKEVRDEYEKYKDTRFTTYTNQKGKTEKQIISFDKVKDQIAMMIYRKKRADNLAKWKRDMLHIYKFSVNEDELEGK